MTRSDALRAGALALAFLLAACAGQGFNARMAGAYSTVTYARDTAGALLDAEVIEPEEAANAQAQANHLRAALDLAAEIHSRDPATATAKLEATIAALDGLRDYLDQLQRPQPAPEPEAPPDGS